MNWPEAAVIFSAIGGFIAVFIKIISAKSGVGPETQELVRNMMSMITKLQYVVEANTKVMEKIEYSLAKFGERIDRLKDEK